MVVSLNSRLESNKEEEEESWASRNWFGGGEGLEMRGGRFGFGVEDSVACSRFRVWGAG